jgi:hypothetical protein
MFVLWLVVLLLSSVGKHNMWSYNDWVCLCCHPSANTICSRIMVGFVVVLVNWKTQHVVVTWLGLSLFTVRKHNVWLYYGWVCCCCHPSVSTVCGRIMVGFVVVLVSQ